MTDYQDIIETERDLFRSLCKEAIQSGELPVYLHDRIADVVRHSEAMQNVNDVFQQIKIDSEADNV